MCLVSLWVPRSCDPMIVLIGQGTQGVGDLVTGEASVREDLTLLSGRACGAHL